MVNQIQNYVIRTSCPVPNSMFQIFVSGLAVNIICLFTTICIICPLVILQLRKQVSDAFLIKSLIKQCSIRTVSEHSGLIQDRINLRRIRSSRLACTCNNDRFCNPVCIQTSFKYLNPVIPGIRNINFPVFIHTESCGKYHLSDLMTRSADLRDKFCLGHSQTKFPDTEVILAGCDIQIFPVTLFRNSQTCIFNRWSGNFRVVREFDSPVLNTLSIRTELLDTVAVLICRINISELVNSRSDSRLSAPCVYPFSVQVKLMNPVAS